MGKVQSKLVGKRFRFGELRPSVEVVVTTGALAKRTDAWGASRTPEISHWSWSEIVRTHDDSFALVTQEGEPIGLWSGRAGKPKLFGTQPTYVVDYMEVHPRYRGGWGISLLSVCCVRAVEVSARGLAVPAIPELEAWYGRLGFVRANKYVWKVPPPLIAMLLRDANFGRLRDLADASLLQEDQ